MSLPWVAEERRRQIALSQAIAELCAHETRKAAAFPTPLSGVSDWSLAVLLGWWLKAGHVLGLCTPDVQQRIESVVGSVPGFGQYPPLWLAMHREALHFPPAELPADVASRPAMKARSESFHDSVLKLLQWLSEPSRQRMVRVDSTHIAGRLAKLFKRESAPTVGPDKDTSQWIGMLEHEFGKLPEHFERLFGDRGRVEFGEPLSSDNIADWLPHWLESKHHGERIHRVRRPILVAFGDRRLVMKGLAVLPEPGVLIRRAAAAMPRMDKESASSPALSPFASTTRALNAVVNQFKNGGRVSQPLLPLLKKLRTEQDSEPMKVFELLIPVLQLLVAVEAATSSDEGQAACDSPPWSILNDLSLALAFDGLELQTTEAKAGARAIPHRAPRASGPSGVRFVWKAAGLDFPLGVIDEPASCDDDLFAAIESVDWRLWALKGVGRSDAEKKVVHALVKDFKRCDWESIKQRALRSSDGAEKDGAMFAFMRCRRLDLEYGRNVEDTAICAVLKLDAFIEDCRHLERLAFDRLEAKDSGAASRLDVPRCRNTGVVDVVQWFSRKRRAQHVPADWRVEWVRDARPVGHFIDERRVNDSYVIRVSAGTIDDADLRILGLPPVEPAGQVPASEGLAATLATFHAAVAAEFASGAQTSDVKLGLEKLRHVFMTTRAAAFHELVERCRKSDEAAGAWVLALAKDSRFRFTCHPSIDFESRAVAPATAGDPYVDWVFDDRVLAGDDVAITFAIDTDNARRVISRGPFQKGSAAALADAVVAAAGTSGTLFDLAVAARRAGDRWTYFPNDAPHPAAAAKKLLDALLDAAIASAEVRENVFALTQMWCAVLGQDVMPAKWTPDRPTMLEDVGGQELAREFHAAMPGSVVVRGFGLTGAGPHPFSGVISAGPAPVGFAALRDAVGKLSGVAPAWAGVMQLVDDLARHALGNTLHLAAPNIYDAFWEAAAGNESAEAQTPVESGKTALVEFLKAAAGLVPFAPSNVGDYPTGWIRESDGTHPRGRHIRKLVRPGLRTMDNTLVRPALVVTE